MKRFLLQAILSVIILSCKKDVTPNPVPPDPPVTPVTQTGLITTDKNFPTADEAFTLTYNPSKGNAALSGTAEDVYVHWGVITSTSTGASDWKYVKSSSFTTPDMASKMVRQTNGQYTITITPRSFFGVPAGERILKIAMVFRNGTGTTVGRNKDGSDIYLPIYTANALNVRFLQPEFNPTYVPTMEVASVSVGQELTVTGTSSQSANIVMSINGVQFATASNATQVTGKAKITSVGQQEIKVTANGTVVETFNLIASGEVITAALPSGAKPNGVTFINGGTSAIFALYAPQKNYVYVIGDFNNWAATANAYMKHTADGNTWWVQIDGLSANQEYAYQYYVDGSLKIADPYTEKILDPDNDQYIPAANNSNFGTYPTGKTTGIVSTMKANQTAYNWQNASITRPAKNDLVIYELLVRDFLGANNYQTLKDTINYLSRLGVNAVELMPVNEFEGNLSWGYNPSFYFTPDKYYGSKQALQAFIDACHAKGIAVIIDMVLNHSFGQSPMVQLYFDNAGNRPAANSPWFNAVPMHPYNVGYDFNHGSTATKSFVKDVLKFWMQEYKIDGFRFDLSKGFTQTNYGTADGNVGAWSSYDAGRVAIWKDYNNYIKSIDNNNFYVILEHFAADNEEKELAGEGMMLWNNVNYNFNEASMGWLDNSNFNRGIYTTHTFTGPENLITYMESHDEERMMYKNIQYGNSNNPAYDVKNIAVGLKRNEMCAAFLFAMPGPKMLWQFGELGYDISIDQNGRTGEKPVLWQYNTVAARVALRDAFAKFINLKKKNNIFKTTNITYNFAGAVKHIKLTDGSNTVVVVGNFDVYNQSASVDFGATGTWYDAANNNQTMNMTSATYSANLAPGAYHIFSRSILAQ